MGLTFCDEVLDFPEQAWFPTPVGCPNCGELGTLGDRVDEYCSREISENTYEGAHFQEATCRNCERTFIFRQQYGFISHAGATTTILFSDSANAA